MKIGIYGYGNLGKGVTSAIKQNADMELFGVFTRRNPADLHIADTRVFAAADAPKLAKELDVMILCGGSATDLPQQTPMLAQYCNVVDSFDTHANIPTHFDAVDKAAKASGHIGIISVGWDPGLFSVSRVYANAVLPQGQDYTFWGKGVSQGHSDAVRRIDGVLDARQYTVPVDAALQAVRGGACPTLTTRQKHTRECFVVAADGADKARIEREICEMPNYFADYDTTVHFISAEEMQRDHSGIPHGGVVIRNGETADGSTHTIEFGLRLDSNPAFTSSVLIAYARAAQRLYAEGARGCKTVLDVPPAYLSAQSGAQLRAHLL